MSFSSEELADRHLVAGFSSGEPELDEWLLRFAAHTARMRTARTYVWTNRDARVAAFFSLCAHSVERDALPAKVGRGSPAVVPAILIAKLALSRNLHGQRLGSELLWDAASRAEKASRQLGARLLVVDAINEAATAFYEHHGFVRCADGRLVQKMSSIAAALGP